MNGVPVPGLGLMLGGALPLVARAGEGKDNTTVLLRGGPGVGKTVYATHLATEIARHFGADVVYACVELLPRELAAQHDGIYPESKPANVHVAPWDKGVLSPERPQILASMLDLGDRLDPKVTRERFETEVVGLFDAAEETSPRVRVLVVDSLSDGYGLGGAAAPRSLADALCKFAAERGISLVLIEETTNDVPSAWSFAVDVVVEIDSEPQRTGRRSLRLTKNRFGPSVGGDAELVIEQEAIALIPPYAVYFDPRTPLPSVQRARGLKWGIPELDALKGLTPLDGSVAVHLVDFDINEAHRFGGDADPQGVNVEINYLGTSRATPLEQPGTVFLRHGGPFLTQESVVDSVVAWLAGASRRGTRVRKVLHRITAEEWLPPGLVDKDIRAIDYGLVHLLGRMGIPLFIVGGGFRPPCRIRIAVDGAKIVINDYDKGTYSEVVREAAAALTPAR